MELWIRSQDKERLIKTIDFYIEEDIDYVNKSSEFDIYVLNLANDDIRVGTYQTKERALEVLNEISSKIKNRYIVTVESCIISKDDIANEYKRLNSLYSGEFIMENPPFEIKPINNDVIYYEMPKE